MVNPELGIVVVFISLLGLVIQLLCAAYHFLDEYYSEMEFFVDGFEIVGVTVKDVVVLLCSRVAERFHHLWITARAMCYLFVANRFPAIIVAYETVSQSEHSDRIARIITDSWQTIDPFYFPELL